MTVPTIRLARGREKKIRARYPWVQREEVASAPSGLMPGDVTRLVSADGEFLAVGTFNPNSRFPFRVFSRDDEELDADWFRARLRQTFARRKFEGTNAQRMIFAEADGIPGLIVDQYDRVAVLQVRHAGIERLRPIWFPVLEELLDVDAIYERSDMDGRRDEGLPPIAGLVSGAMPEEVWIHENGLRFGVPVTDGLKTGFYLDQRDARARLASRIQPGDRFLDGFCYLGAFSQYAARAGAKTLGLDLHEVALAAAGEGALANGLDCEFRHANVFEWLENEPVGELFDWILLDPPAIAKKSDKRDALKWAVWKLVYHAIPHLREGGRLIVCSCVYQLGQEALLEAIRLAAADRGKAAFLEEMSYQAPDHPYLLAFPESLYLKSAWVRIES
jgi:23S rRNA (cytosine1962-C5)-methyltransferase